MARRTVFPNDLRDWLSILSIVGFLAIFLRFTFDINFLDNIMTSIFLLVAGGILLMVGKVVTVRRWLKDGIQQNEFIQLFAIIFGIGAIVSAIILFFGEIPQNMGLFVGLLALAPAIFILSDYLIKNT